MGAGGIIVSQCCLCLGGASGGFHYVAGNSDPFGAREGRGALRWTCSFGEAHRESSSNVGLAGRHRETGSETAVSFCCCVTELVQYSI